VGQREEEVEEPHVANSMNNISQKKEGRREKAKEEGRMKRD